MDMKEQVRQVQSVVLHMMCDIDDYCRKKGIRYYLSGGTCLGAVRHHGFIPWDDDADLMMPRPDYERFIRSFGKECGKRYGCMSLRTDPDWHRPASRVWDKRTTVRAKMFDEKTIGVFIDIFPIDGLPEGKLAQRLFYGRLKVLNVVRNASIRKDFWEEEKYRAAKKVLALFARRVSPRRLAIRIDHIAKRYPFEDSREVGAILALHYGSRETIKKELMSSAVWIPFEGREFPVPIGYDTYLSNLYGDYMQIPKDAEERGYTHMEGYEVLLDVED